MPNLRGPKKARMLNAGRRLVALKSRIANRMEHLPGTVWERATTSTTGKNSPYGAKNKAGEIRYFKTPSAAKRFASE